MEDDTGLSDAKSHIEDQKKSLEAKQQIRLVIVQAAENLVETKWLQRWREQNHDKCPRCSATKETVDHVLTFQH